MTVSEDFASQTTPFRGELLAYCYRMLGSPEDAEDLVQETYLRAWRSYQAFEGRASVRTWLYRIATNACLTALARRPRRPLPSGLAGPADDPAAPLLAAPEVTWLRPIPDALLPGALLPGALVPGALLSDALLAARNADPAAVTASRAGIRLAFVAALQHLTARQRAMLILRDVIDWSAAEVADLLGTTTTAVNSGLRRARAQLAEALPAEDDLAEPAGPAQRAILDRFATAFENADITLLAELLRQDVALEMPPMRAWFEGRESVIAFFRSAAPFAWPGSFRMVQVFANGQPAFAAYQLGPDGAFHAHAITVPTITSSGISRIVTFLDPGLLGLFDLPSHYAPFAGQRPG